MHGIVFFELHRFADSALPEGSWDRITEAAGLKGSFYTPLESYPDEQLFRLVAAASRLSGLAHEPLLQTFGVFLAPELMKMYRHLMKPSWRALDVIEHTEAVIHAVVRVKNPGATPPILRAARTAPDELVLHYSSKRRMCSIAKGIAEGIGRHFSEPLSIADEACMLRGDPECILRLRVASAPAPR